MNLRVAMIQDGARRRYAVPAALHRASSLEVMYTDLFRRGGRGRRACAELDNARIKTNPVLALRARLAARRFDSQTAYYHWVSQQTARWIMRKGVDKANMLLGYIRNVHPDLLAWSQQQGLLTVGDQIIAPAAVEIEHARHEAQRWPGWQDDATLENLASVADFEKQSWQHLDHILCMSNFVRDGLVSQGVHADKITRIPYPIDANQFYVPKREDRRGPVTVGFTGALNLRKGAPCVLEVAKRFDPRHVKFVMVGQNYLNEKMLAKHRSHVEIVGRVPRTEISTWLKRFDIFFFPSTCEGSAGSVIEALASGLPVVTTHNSGSLVRHGIEGHIVPCGDLDGFCDAITELVDDKNKRIETGRAARQRAEQFHPAWYATTLARTLQQIADNSL